MHSNIGDTGHLLLRNLLLKETFIKKMAKHFLLYKLREITPSSFVYSSIKSCQPALLFELLDFQAYTKSKFY